MQNSASSGSGGEFLTYDFAQSIHKKTAREPLGIPWECQGCASWARTPRDPKSHLFVTNRVAIQPFCTIQVGKFTELRRESRQIDLTPSISTFLLTIVGPNMPQIVVFVNKNSPCEERAHQVLEKNTPWGPWGAPGGPRTPIVLLRCGEHLRCTLHWSL